VYAPAKRSGSARRPPGSSPFTNQRRNITPSCSCLASADPGAHHPCRSRRSAPLRPSSPVPQVLRPRPLDQQSGQFRGTTKQSKYGNARLRCAFWMAATVAVRQTENSFRDKFERYLRRDPPSPSCHPSTIPITSRLRAICVVLLLNAVFVNNCLRNRRRWLAYRRPLSRFYRTLRTQSSSFAVSA
jgi:hypothetical protein